MGTSKIEQITGVMFDHLIESPPCSIEMKRESSDQVIDYGKCSRIVDYNQLPSIVFEYYRFQVH